MGLDQGSLGVVDHSRETGGGPRGGFWEACLGSGVREAAMAAVCSSQSGAWAEDGDQPGKESAGAEPVTHGGTGGASLLVSRGAKGKPPTVGLEPGGLT